MLYQSYLWDNFIILKVPFILFWKEFLYNKKYLKLLKVIIV